MIQNSFIHFPGIGVKSERLLWKEGILSWGDFINKATQLQSRLDKNKILYYIKTSLNKLNENEVIFFYNNLPSSEEWRLFKEFQNHCLYLDIETNGGDSFSGFITTIATFDGDDIKYYVNGENLDDFVTDVLDYKILITYNGKTFDIPFIENYFNIQLNHAQIDLRYTLASLGFRGGLKNCEQQLGLKRYGFEGVDGYFAIHLWNDYYYNANQKALETLLAYNIEDCINLERLMQISYNQKIDGLGFENFEKIPDTRIPGNIFQPHLRTISAIRSKINANY